MENVFYLLLFLITISILAGLVLGVFYLFRRMSLQLPSMPNAATWLNSFWARLIFLVALGAALLWPLNLTKKLVEERRLRYRSVSTEIANSWGRDQTFVGPILVVPYEITYQTEVETVIPVAIIDGQVPDKPLTRKETKTIVEKRTAAILPKNLAINGQITTEKRSRGIYDILVYASDLKVTGSFSRQDLTKLDSRVTQVKWAETQLLVGLSDTNAFRGVSPLKFGAKEYYFAPGVNNSPLLPAGGFYAALDLSDQAESEPFEFAIAIGGLNNFMVAPVAELTTLELASPYPHPSFIGRSLPFERKINSDGFTAKWSVPNLVRNYPQVFTINALNRDNDARGNSSSSNTSPLYENLLGVTLVEPIALYTVVTRAVKYAILFIGLTFLSFFLYEVATRYSKTSYRLHFGQYAVIGLALALFYLVLLASAEQLGFAPAYGLAAGLIIVLVAGYAAIATASGMAALVLALVMGALYGVLYVILNSEDQALIGGASLLVVALVALMFSTRDLAKKSLKPALPAPGSDPLAAKNEGALAQTEGSPALIEDSPAQTAGDPEPKEPDPR
ncbi:MAG: cell envelope integrity protein CreD [Deltaproteobacteria bacterium]|jgi:inner membrane protein|nr:cell envelope integrity protein CreD [Deltaproteobacteria bacterium]